MANPIIKWAGGKRQLLNRLSKYVPETYGTYYEPFFGGGALFFSLKLVRAVINDINPHLINMYRVLRDDPKELGRLLLKLETEYNSLASLDEKKTYYYKMRGRYNDISKKKYREVNKEVYKGEIEGKIEEGIKEGIKEAKCIDDSGITGTAGTGIAETARIGISGTADAGISGTANAGIQGGTGAEVSKEEAALLIFLNKSCFNGLYRENKSGEFNVPFGGRNSLNIAGESALNAISEAAACLAGAMITEGDFEKACKDAGAGDFVFFDSPYHGTFDTYQKGGFPDSEHERLAELFRKLTEKGVYCLLTNSDSQFIRDLYDEYDIENVSVRRSVNRDAAGRTGSEIIVSNINMIRQI